MLGFYVLLVTSFQLPKTSNPSTELAIRSGPCVSAQPRAFALIQFYVAKSELVVASGNKVTANLRATLRCACVLLFCCQSEYLGLERVSAFGTDVLVSSGA